MRISQSVIALALTISAASAATLGSWNGTVSGSWSSSQLQGWTSVTTPSGSGSFNAGSITNMANGSWSLWSETAQSEARWTFDGGALSVGQTLKIDWRNNSIASGRVVQMSLYRSDGTEAFGFRFLGGGSNYSIKGDGTWFEEDSMPYQNTALTLSFQLVSTNQYVFKVIRKSDSATLMETGTYGLGGTSGLGLTYFEVYNNARVAGSSDLNLNTITVIPEPSTALLLGLGLGAMVWLRRRNA